MNTIYILIFLWNKSCEGVSVGTGSKFENEILLNMSYQTDWGGGGGGVNFFDIVLV